jgi:hypothetical protein
MTNIHTRTILATGTALVLVCAPTLCHAQTTGVSHPDETYIPTAQDGTGTVATSYQSQPSYPAQPAGQQYISTPPQPASLPTVPADSSAYKPYQPYKPVPAVPPKSSPEDGMVVGDEVPSSAQPSPRPRVDVNEGVVVRVAGPSNQLPVGTIVKTRLLLSLSTKATSEGSEWTAKLEEPMTRDGQIYIPAGSLVRGKVTQVHGGKRISGNATLYLMPLSVTLPDGSARALHAQLIDTSATHTLKVDREGMIEHRSHKKEEAGVLALTTGSGAAAGGMIAGVPGALVGAGVGAGVSGVMWLKADRQAELPKDTELTFELTRAMSFGNEAQP